MFRGQLYCDWFCSRCIFPANHARSAQIATVRDVRANFQRELLLASDSTVRSTVDVEVKRRSEVGLEWTSKLSLDHVCCVLLTGGRSLRGDETSSSADTGQLGNNDAALTS